MRYQGITPMSYSIKTSIRIYEFDTCYIITTFKIGTRAFESAYPNNAFDFLTSIDIDDELFELLSENKPVYILIKNPLDRLITGGIQVTFESASEMTSAFSLARWGSEDYYFTNYFPKFVSDDVDDPSMIYEREFDTKYLKDFKDSKDLWKIWLEIINFNIRMGNGHLSYYHRDCYHNIYKIINSKYDVRIIEDTEMKDPIMFNKLTGRHFKSDENFSNRKWKDYIKLNIINDVYDNSNQVYLNPKLITDISVSIQKYLSDEFTFYNSFKKLIK